MKTAIFYYSRHHGNTLKVLKAMAESGEIDLFDVTQCQDPCPEEYDCVGFASGIYAFTVHKSVIDFARRHLPAGKPVFFVYTYGGAKGNSTKALAEIAKEKGCPILGEFGCRGYDTFGPFKLVGGVGKGLPSAQDLENAKTFYGTITDRYDRSVQK